MSVQVSGGSHSGIIRSNMNDVFKKMFNNPKFSNVKFTVNDDVFYAERAILSVSSKVWDAFLSLGPDVVPTRLPQGIIHEINFTSIKHSESFLINLKFIYEFQINVLNLSDEVLEEAIQLANDFDLQKFHDFLLNYIARFRPHMKSVLDMYNNTLISYLQKLNLNDSGLSSRVNEQ